MSFRRLCIGGSRTAACAVAMLVTFVALVAASPASAGGSITVEVVGEGKVVGEPGAGDGIDCGQGATNCEEFYADECFDDPESGGQICSVGAGGSLSAVPAAGWTFRGWQGCTATSANPAECTFFLQNNATRNVKATFGRGEPIAAFDWSMPPRARDADRDGLLDIESVPAGGWFPTSWTLKLDGCDSSGDLETITGYTWNVEDVGVFNSTNCRLDVQVPEERQYRITLTVRTATKSASVTRDVVVEDRLIVVLGDSYASGEGNPHVDIDYGEWPEGGVVSEPLWADKRCHRSGYAASAKAAAQLEHADPRSSVTFLMKACSGAQITSGILNNYEGVDPKDINNPVPPQITTVRELLNRDGVQRRIDDLIISIGGNDIGFGDIIASCLLIDGCHNDSHTNQTFENAMDDLVAPPGSTETRRYERLRERIKADLNVRTTYITEYPDFTTAADGSRCAEIGADLTGTGTLGLIIRTPEADWASGTVLGRLNGALRGQVDKARAIGLDWRYVDGVVSAWTAPGVGHGYCIGDPKLPHSQRWVRTFTEACDMQGPPAGYVAGLHWCSPDGPTGSFHPNRAGQNILANRYAGFLNANPPPPTVPDREPPSVAVPSDITRMAAYGARGIPVDFAAGVSDNVTSPAPVVGCTPASGSIFTLGRTTVTCTGRDAAGHEAAATFGVTITDTVKPDTTLLKGPKGTTKSRSPKFTFRTTEPIGGKFQCKLDRGAWRKCSSPKTYRGLKRGYHTFQVRAIDKAGNKDKTAAKRTWRIK